MTAHDALATIERKPTGPGVGPSKTGSSKEAPPRFHLKTPSLSFDGVDAHGSAVLPLVVQGAPDQLLHLEVVVPPLAPFSITEPPAAAGRRKGDHQGAHLWVRYDARSGTARDESEVVIRAAGTDREWVVALRGCGHLVRSE
jgi:hypothetical protein